MLWGLTLNMAKFNQNFPSLTQALTGPDGHVNQSWLQFFLSLWNRTGAAEAAVSAVQVQYSEQGTSSLTSPVGQLAQIDGGKLLGNASTISAIPTPVTLSAFIDAALGNTEGGILTRTSAGWVLLPPGLVQYVLTSQGSSGDLVWSAVQGLPTIADKDLIANLSGVDAIPVAHTLSEILDYILSNVQGSVVFRSGSVWTTLAPGSTGYVLQTNGASANVSWASPASVVAGGSKFLLTPAQPGFDIQFSGIGGSIVLSNSNKTMTPVSASPFNVAHGSPARQTGKLYWEGQFAATTFLGIGVSGGFGHDVTTGGNRLGDDQQGQLGWQEGGSVRFLATRGGGVLSTIATYTAGNRLSVAVDLDALLIWFRVGAGNWNNNVSANPATGVGGLSCAMALSGSADYLLWPSMSNGSTSAANMYLLPADFTQSVPTGFSAWGS